MSNNNFINNTKNFEDDRKKQQTIPTWSIVVISVISVFILVLLIFGATKAFRKYKINRQTEILYAEIDSDEPMHGPWKSPVEHWAKVNGVWKVIGYGPDYEPNPRPKSGVYSEIITSKFGVDPNSSTDYLISGNE